MTDINAPSEPQDTSWHCVSERWRCYEIEKKYGWNLLKIEPTPDSLLKYKCIFEGQTRFPNYLEDLDD
jgi:hypothetical protein